MLFFVKENSTKAFFGKFKTEKKLLAIDLLLMSAVFPETFEIPLFAPSESSPRVGTK
jgi:hypothetical protein